MSRKVEDKYPDAVTCDLCSRVFGDDATLDAHQRTELNRHQPTNAFLYMPKLEKCYSDEALWAQSWRRQAGIWTKPPMPKKRAHRINPDETYQCLLCKKDFRDVTPFLSHFVHTYTDIERCLDADELKALHYEQGSSGVWRANPFTQMLPSQAARLPTVRQELAAFEAAERSTISDEQPSMTTTNSYLVGAY